MTKALNADPGYKGLICKNPEWSAWRTIYSDVSFGLLELNEYLPSNVIPFPGRGKKSQTEQLPALGRNCRYFDVARVWAYKAVSGFQDEEQFQKSVRQKVEQLNTEDLPASEVRSITRSIYKWVWARRALTREEILERQKHAAQKTNSVRRNKTRSRITEAVETLTADGQSITQSKVAALAKVSLSAVKRAWNWVNNVAEGVVSHGPPHQLLAAPEEVQRRRSGARRCLAVVAVSLLPSAKPEDDQSNGEPSFGIWNQLEFAWPDSYFFEDDFDQPP